MIIMYNLCLSRDMSKIYGLSGLKGKVISLICGYIVSDSHDDLFK